MDSAEKLLEPIESYRNCFKDEYKEKAKELLDNLVEQSKIDISQNKKDVEDLNHQGEKLANLKKEKSSLERKSKVFKILFIIIIIYGIYLAINTYKKIGYDSVYYEISKISILFSYYVKEIIQIILIPLICGFTYKYVFKRLPAIILEMKHKITSLDEIYEKKLRECLEQTRKLTSLFDRSIPNRLITDVIPSVHLDDYFELRRYGDLTINYGLRNRMNEDQSSIDLVSGDVLGNSFLISKSFAKQMLKQSYHGTRTVSYEVSYTDSDGNQRYETVTETLHATIYKPKPDYYKYITLIYGNDAADRLTFTRKPHQVHTFGSLKMKMFMNKQRRAIKKRSHKAIMKGGSFVEMANEEFEALFNALDRTDENGFRLLFTPIAQRNMIKLLKDKEFGDTFTFKKDHKLNEIINHQDWEISLKNDDFDSPSFEVIKDRYLRYLTNYFDQFYRLFLPILSIPVLHQHKAESYIYEDEFSYNFNPYMSEMMANEFSQKTFRHPESITPSILKTKTLKSSENKDLVEVTSHSYKGEERIDFIPVKAGNHKYYDVPVPWIEYIPITNVREMVLSHVGLSDHEFMEYESNDDTLHAYKYGVQATIR